jgi:hypothetical protein
MSVCKALAFQLVVWAAFAGVAWGVNAAQPADTSTENARTGAHSGFVTRLGSDLYVRGRQFRFVGSNNYYPIYKSQFMVDALFDTALRNDFTVMRVWGAIDIGNQDGSNSVDGAGKKAGHLLSVLGRFSSCLQ